MEWDAKRMTKAVAWRTLLALAVSLGLGACSVVTERESTQASQALNAPELIPPEQTLTGAVKALQVALAQQGTRYRAGGASPDHGFDCSGLVYFSYQSVGISLPRTAQDMFRHARRIDESELRPGDLVFFRLRSSRISHVGIYAGAGRFVHAPSKGKDVELASMNQAYWRKRYAGAGRIEDEPSPGPSPHLAAN